MYMTYGLLLQRQYDGKNMGNIEYSEWHHQPNKTILSIHVRSIEKHVGIRFLMQMMQGM